MAFLKAVLVSQNWIGVSDAGPGRAVAELRLRDGPERVPVADGVVRRSQRSRHDNLRTDLESLGIAGIECQEFLPAASIAKP